MSPRSVEQNHYISPGLPLDCHTRELNSHLLYSTVDVALNSSQEELFFLDLCDKNLM